ncbi:BirA family biotin operon repressor/biotin-[acetyl-CoA-carboxylase] ligase [Halarchaeum rubridurum]|uniref:Bifunctional biotin--[acetyl-CoA-carboxylase] synthetase/biotin operon repressor n=1 Tax=Halarchaeum rubridurum TaxID=489911 RepID=A0A830FSS2_9EURY|nr:biotin--[acetyl-CoA-carboxylase] ligase [Halarchaeum rubridurum]MBP1953779.1 BirA family biotin operon repressor/biotin-[acetyl-CoA-carboxylase] ligase [Halarchaeum rubridurum]GGM54633.1 bifunctional biotin--[acetyl-CoA-carboxylase] synthetase/biotin operon repressor [Halarchaeum rubridurum]
MNDTRRAVLDALADGPVAGPALADRLGVSRAAVWKHVEALRDAGFGIESTGEGYVLDAIPEFGGLAVEYGCEAPFEVEYHETLPSTNDRARDLAADGASDVVVLADEQTGGRGRLDRAWSSPPGGVWLSVVCRPALAPSRVSLLTVAASAAACGAVREAGVDARIKWPNDLLVPDPDAERGGRKLAGLLTEMEGEAGRVSWVVLGLGLNANVPADALPADADATSLLVERGGDPVDRRRLVQRFLERFDDLRDDPDAARDAWRDHAATLGQRVRVTLPSETIVGEAVDVTEVGALVVDTGTERRVVHAGDCEHLRPAE